MADLEGGKNKNNNKDEKPGRAGKYIGAALGAGLAGLAAGAANAQSADVHVPYDSYDTGTTYTEGVEFSASNDAILFVEQRHPDPSI